jgi:hypothetical protein
MLLAILLSLATARGADAQLVSPGKLAAPHAQLEGLGNCTKCHDLGKRGASDTKCLSCHSTLAKRIEAKKGLHASYTTRNCASCHKEHFGTEFALVRFDTSRFDHKKETGFELRLAHAETSCRTCHTGGLIADTAVRRYATEHRTLDRTFLGLATGCLDCHAGENVHADQFGKRACTACHTEATWKKAPLFFHDSTRYPLTGSHRTAKCESCHKPMAVAGIREPVTRYVGVKAGSCAACHADPHQGRMRQPCESCHNTTNWTRLTNRSGFESSFDHGRTRFALAGAHASAPCASCHAPATHPTRDVRITFVPSQARTSYPAPRVSSGCLSCHVDVHDSAFVRTPGGRNCQNCHGETAWIPSAYDLTRHNRESYQLTGAHIAVACRSCHLPVREGGPPRFSPLPRDCATCHKLQDPHAGQFTGRACTDCHVAETFRVAAFDHAKTRYPLDGAHRGVACAKCHPTVAASNGAAVVRYRPLETTCKACHGAAIPRRP